MKLCAASQAIAILAAVSLAAACVGSKQMNVPQRVGETLSPTLTPFVYFEDGAVMFVGVDGRAAQYIKQGTLFPLGVGLANRSKDALTFDRESFVLESEAGKRYPLASIQEFERDYNRASIDRRLADSFLEALRTRFATFDTVSRPMFPDPATPATAIDRFELARRTWTHLVLYFPIPEQGIHGKRFKLLVSAKAVPETFVVDFAVR